MFAQTRPSMWWLTAFSVVCLAYLAAATDANASRPPTEQEQSELTTAARLFFQKEGAEEIPLRLTHVKISTRNESFGSAETERHSYTPFLFFGHNPQGEWEVVGGSDGCVLPEELPMPDLVAIELGSCKPEHSQRTTLPCAWTPNPGEWGFFVRPHECNEYSGVRDHADETWLVDLHWQHWQSPRAIAHGRWKYEGMGVFSGPASAVAYRRLGGPRCSGKSYTRLRVRTLVNGRTYVHVFRLPTC